MTVNVYDRIGVGYARFRAPDPRLRAAILDALGDAAFIVNVGAGTGSYEPVDRRAVAVEPSMTMIAQRPLGGAPCVCATAEALPFPNRAFDADYRAAVELAGCQGFELAAPANADVLLKSSNMEGSALTNTAVYSSKWR